MEQAWLNYGSLATYGQLSSLIRPTAFVQIELTKPINISYFLQCPRIPSTFWATVQHLKDESYIVFGEQYRPFLLLQYEYKAEDFTIS